MSSPIYRTQGESMIQQRRTRQYVSNILSSLVLITTALLLSCTPRVEVAVPEKPITINLNVKIDHEVRVKVEKDLDNVFTDQSDLF